MKRIVPFAVAALLAGVAAGPAFAWDDCGCDGGGKKKRVNAGVGNGAEYGSTEKYDRDPGNSGAHNQAGKNSFKPNSSASAWSY